MKRFAAILFNVLTIYNGTVIVGEIVKTSGNVVYIKPCGSRAIGDIPVNKRDVIYVNISCREYLRDYK